MKTNRTWAIAFWFYIGIILSISMSAYLKIIPNEIERFPYYDTILHFLLIGFSAFLGHLAFNKRKIDILNFSLPLVPIIISFFVLIEECLQMFSPHRSFDLVDLAADFCGMVVFTLLAEMVKPKGSSEKKL
ncbi:VanZ like family protein [Rivularia sp. PCC 7116]|uniref:VanZ family protein n=1 Tax=Rivularia sp. PCC 7116 TaxID=373994 RepID=UPI00029F276D|nr:VanZ family protein [Rivularia sp. PCC 7116]AFY56943.1 VanZ like family protein [Rivularia sp. PCC 7116]